MTSIGSGCSPKFVKQELPKLPEITVPAPVDASILNLPEIPKPESTIVIQDGIEYIGYTVKEHNKIVEKIKQAKLYEKTAKLLVQKDKNNSEIIFSLKDIINMQDYTSRVYQQLWQDADTAYRKEKFIGQVDKGISVIMQILLSLGIVLLAF